MTEKPTSSKVESPLEAAVEKTNEVDPTEKILSGLQAVVVLAGILICLYLYQFASAGLSSEQEHWGQFGDYFGGTLNPIIGLMTLLALVWTFRLQHQLLREAKRQVKVSEDELKRTSEALEKQATLQRKQAFESTFFSLLSAWQSLSAQIDMTRRGNKYSGKDCFKIIHEELKFTASGSTVPFHTALPTDARGQARGGEDRDFAESHLSQDYVQRFWGEIVDASTPSFVSSYLRTYFYFRSDLGAYSRSLYHIIKFVDRSGLSDRERKEYTNIVRALFSPYEHVLIMYNALSPFGWEKFFPLVNKYSLLKNIDKSLLLSSDDGDYFPAEAWASSPTIFPDEHPDRIEQAIGR